MAPLIIVAAGFRWRDYWAAINPESVPGSALRRGTTPGPPVDLIVSSNDLPVYVPNRQMPAVEARERKREREARSKPARVTSERKQVRGGFDERR